MKAKAFPITAGTITATRQFPARGRKDRCFGCASARSLLVGLLSSMALGACASVPREGSLLSAELAERISAIESSHFSLLHSYMDLRRERINQFIAKEWLPVFAKEYLNDERIAPMWQQVSTAGTEADRLEFFMIVAEGAQASISGTRDSLIDLVDKCETLIERRLRNEYAQAKSMNAALTGLLASASEVSEARGEMLSSFGVTSERLTPLLSGVDSALITLNKVENAAEAFDRIKNQLTGAAEALSQGRPARSSR